ncbi:MAG TPA: hemerythrin HHE cation-binding protein [Gallionellaceae bacterium]|nr:hemerythrin HHE cation-binding protein [Gallionellaceae bacterium]
MMTISELLTPQHKHCDDLFAATEAAAAKGEWVAASAGFDGFRAAMLRHFALEEEIMFPAFEARTGMTQGPTAVMRSEHRQMTGLLDQLAHALAVKEGDAFLGEADTLLTIMQQHNIKEEQMLYRMADQVLATVMEEVVGRMRAMA